MRIELPREAERFGPIIIHDVQKIYELDAGLKYARNETAEGPIQRISYESIHDIQEQMAIVVPVRNERIKLIEGVLCGIPHHCLIIVVSNSPREPIDRYSIEQDAIAHMGRFMDKQLMIVHQKDPALAKACEASGYQHLLDKQGNIRDGKAEGMALATFLAVAAGKKYIGFIDSDNYFPGSVHEYVQAYSAGFHASKSRYSMVRISWHSKPKVVESSLFFAKRGRASEHTNRFLNRLVSTYTGFGTEIIKTGNAGEHAMTLDLAVQLAFSSGYSIEPYHFIYLLERFGGIMKTIEPQVLKERIELFQIESRNPHLHEVKGDEHVKDMSRAALEVIYRSPITPPSLKEEILEDMLVRKLIAKKDKFKDSIRYYPPIETADLSKFQAALQQEPYAAFLQGDVTRFRDKVEEPDRGKLTKEGKEMAEGGKLAFK
jgi:mannosyl-3-phosphoglycerate synthase